MGISDWAETAWDYSGFGTKGLGPRNLSSILGMDVPENPGGNVGNAQPDKAWALQPVPGTNFEYNPATGQYYIAGTNGTQVAQNPNLANQAAGATSVQNMFLQQQQDAAARAAATRAGQTGLATSYQDAITGRGPSVAGVQLTTGLGQIAADQNAQAAGVGGQNAFAARRAAANNIARAGTALSGQQALLRAQETAAGRTGLNQLYGVQTAADTAANTNSTSGALGFGGLAEEAEADRIGANQSAAEANAKANAAIFKGIGSMAGLF